MIVLLHCSLSLIPVSTLFHFVVIISFVTLSASVQPSWDKDKMTFSPCLSFRLLRDLNLT